MLYICVVTVVLYVEKERVLSEIVKTVVAATTIYIYYHPKAFVDFAAASSNACFGYLIP